MPTQEEFDKRFAEKFLRGPKGNKPPANDDVPEEDGKPPKGWKKVGASWIPKGWKKDGDDWDEE